MTHCLDVRLDMSSRCVESSFPEFVVENLVPTVYHLNYECNLTIYDIECEDNLP